MKTLLAGTSAVMLLWAAGSVQAQTTDDATPGAMAPAPMSGSSSSATPGHYNGVDTAGVREHVKAPYGGNNQSQADRREEPVTEKLNQQELVAPSPSEMPR